jgi:hypothetical protein
MPGTIDHTDTDRLLKRRSDLSLLFIDRVQEGIPALIDTLTENALSQSPQEKLDGETQTRVDTITERKTTADGREIKISVGIDPRKDLVVLRPAGRHRRLEEQYVAGKNNGTEEAYPGEDQDRGDIIEQALLREQARINATMSVLDELRIPYVVTNDSANNRGVVNVTINQHDFEQAVAPFREISDPHKAATAFWDGAETGGFQDRPELQNGQVVGSALGTENARRAKLPELQIAKG